MMKEMTVASQVVFTHTSARMMNEATGVDLSTPSSGRARTSIRRNRQQSPARAVPKRTPSKKPSRMRRRELATVSQKSAPVHSCPNRKRTARGEGSSSGSPTAIEASCHSSSQTATRS